MYGVVSAAISAGASVATAHASDDQYLIRVIIELENWSNWVLHTPKVHIDAGVLCVPPSNILPLKKEALSARKTKDTATGSYATVSWLVGSLNKRIVVMWSAPYDFNLYSNWMGLGITTADVHDDSWFDRMYYERTIPEMQNYKIAEFNRNNREIMVEDGDFEFKGIMGNGHHTTIKLYIKPKDRNNIPEVIRDCFD
ncbi:unnamed protein product [Brachionus calyciflorus]|uniref:Uncharacterized protein n=1 Tax=Brachionus calyciflorus TaxID=104777 RepID=A0A814M0Y5_9BILA|nr:unnamed protein product [Brachionus calyciflorus]